MKKPSISIIIRNKDNESTLERTLTSVVEQTIPAMIENALLIDDNSSDNSVHLVRQKFPNVKILENPAPGAVQALNFGISQCYTDYYTILDSDDALPSHTIEFFSTSLINNPRADAMYGNYVEINTEGIHKKVSTKENIFNTIAGGILFKTKTVKKLGCYDSELFFPEYDLLIKLLEQYSVAHLDETVYYYFRQPTSLTANSSNVAKGIEQLKKKYGKSFPIREY